MIKTNYEYPFTFLVQYITFEKPFQVFFSHFKSFCVKKSKKRMSLLQITNYNLFEKEFKISNILQKAIFNKDLSIFKLTLTIQKT